VSRCTVIIPDAGPFNSLWVADRLDLLLRLDMRLIVIDAVYDELTSDPSYPKDRDVKAFIDGNRPPFVIETTEIGRLEREKRASGLKLRRNAGELAIVDFMSSEDGLPNYVGVGEPVVILFEDSDMRVFNKPPNLHLLSTVGLLRGLEKVGVIPSADEVIHEMTHPSRPDRRPHDARAFTDLPGGVDEPAATGSTWEP
jgi:predicted nucleic acid-binding protein